MENRSWFSQNGFYYTLLAFFILLHLILLFIRLSREARVTHLKDQSFKVFYVNKDIPDNLKQIVNSDDPQKNMIKKKADYLSDKNRSFEKQTKSKIKEKISLGDLGAFAKNHHPLKNFSQIAKKVRDTNYLKNINDGDSNNLNTAEFKFFGYFQRIKKQVEAFWTIRLRDLAAFKKISTAEFKTFLIVILDSQGKINSLSIYGPSGLLELDKIALDSFVMAGSFPNPPKELIKNGQVRLEWGFIVNPRY
jgi:protein TonB